MTKLIASCLFTMAALYVAPLLQKQDHQVSLEERTTSVYKSCICELPRDNPVTSDRLIVMQKPVAEVKAKAPEVAKVEAVEPDPFEQKATIPSTSLVQLQQPAKTCTKCQQSQAAASGLSTVGFVQRDQSQCGSGGCNSGGCNSGGCNSGGCSGRRRILRR